MSRNAGSAARYGQSGSSCVKCSLVGLWPFRRMDTSTQCARRCCWPQKIPVELSNRKHHMAKPRVKQTTVIDRDKERAEKARGDFRGPTPERLGMAIHGYEVGDDQQGGKVYFIELRPIVAMLKARQIDGK